MMSAAVAGSKNKSSRQLSRTFSHPPGGALTVLMDRLRPRLHLPVIVHHGQRIEPEGVSMGSPTRPNTRQPQRIDYSAKIPKAVEKFLVLYQQDPDKYEKTARQLCDILTEVNENSSVSRVKNDPSKTFTGQSQDLNPHARAICGRGNADKSKAVVTSLMQTSLESSSSRSVTSNGENNIVTSSDCVTVTNSSESISSPGRSNGAHLNFENGDHDFTACQSSKQATNKECCNDSDFFCSKSFTDPQSKNICTERLELKISSNQSAEQPMASSAETHVQKELPSKDQNEDKDIEVTNDQNPLFILQQNKELHLIVNSITKPMNCTLITYNLADSFTIHRSSQDIKPEDKTILCPTNSKIFCCKDKIFLMTGILNKGRWKLNLYNLDTETENLFALWKPANCAIPIIESKFDHENCIPVSHGDNVVIIATVKLNLLIFHIINIPSSGKNQQVSATLTLPQLNARHAKYKLDSCITMSNYIYCSLSDGTKTRVYKLSIRKMQQFQKSNIFVRPEYTWQITDDHTLLKCFLSTYKEEAITICCYTSDEKTILGIKRLKPNKPTVSLTEYKFEFSNTIKIISVSVVPCFSNLVIVVLYEENKSNKCYIKRIAMPSTNPIQCSSPTDVAMATLTEAKA